MRNNNVTAIDINTLELYGSIVIGVGRFSYQYYDTLLSPMQKWIGPSLWYIAMGIRFCNITNIACGGNIKLFKMINNVKNNNQRYFQIHRYQFAMAIFETVTTKSPWCLIMVPFIAKIVFRVITNVTVNAIQLYVSMMVAIVSYDMRMICA